LRLRMKLPQHPPEILFLTSFQVWQLEFHLDALHQGRDVAPVLLNGPLEVDEILSQVLQHISEIHVVLVLKTQGANLIDI
jgi:hypothetical protein